MEQTFANPSAPPPASKISSPALAHQEPGLNVHYQTSCTLNQKYPLFKTLFFFFLNFDHLLHARSNRSTCTSVILFSLYNNPSFLIITIIINAEPGISLTHLILTRTLGRRHYYSPHFTYEEIETQRGYIACPRSHSGLV